MGSPLAISKTNIIQRKSWTKHELKELKDDVRLRKRNIKCGMSNDYGKQVCQYCAHEITTTIAEIIAENLIESEKENNESAGVSARAEPPSATDGKGKVGLLTIRRIT